MIRVSRAPTAHLLLRESRRYWLLSLVVSFSAALSGCSFLYSADQEQCRTNAECSLGGVCFEGLCRLENLSARCDSDEQCGDYVCLSNVCRDVGDLWSCHRRYEIPDTTAPIPLYVKFYDQYGGLPPTGGTAKLCELADPECTSPLAIVDDVLDESGETRFLLPPNLLTFFEIEAPGTRPTIVSVGVPGNAVAAENGFGYAFQAATEELISVLETNNDVKMPIEGSHGMLWLRNCADVLRGPADVGYEGLRVELAPSLPETQILYLNRQLRVETIRSTEFPLIALVNLPPGVVEAVAYLTVAGESVEVARATLVSRPGYFTWGLTWPQSRLAP